MNINESGQRREDKNTLIKEEDAANGVSALLI